MHSSENSIIEARILYHSNSYTYIVLLFKIQVNDVMVEYNYFLCSIWTPPFYQAPFKSLTNFSAFSQ